MFQFINDSSFLHFPYGCCATIDIVLRVIAAQLEPSNCSVVRVMTPHPDTAPSSMTIMDALRKMHGNYSLLSTLFISLISYLYIFLTLF